MKDSIADDPLLIAAAPDLLKACQTMLDAFQLIPVPDCMNEQECEEYRGLEAARQNLKAAIAKATDLPF